MCMNILRTDELHQCNIICVILSRSLDIFLQPLQFVWVDIIGPMIVNIPVNIPVIKVKQNDHFGGGHTNVIIEVRGVAIHIKS